MTNEEAVEKLKILKEDYWDDDGYGNESQLYDDTALALDMAIKALEDSRWIPVTERLPDIGVPVLTFDGYVFLVEKRIEWIWGDNEKIYSEWWVQGYDADNENPIGLRDGAVTAWMPLPKPYEGSETE